VIIGEASSLRNALKDAVGMALSCFGIVIGIGGGALTIAWVVSMYEAFFGGR
jgi:hypothetical protein